MSEFSAEVTGYDLSSTGTIVEYEVGPEDTRIGYVGTATASANYALEVRGRNVGWVEVSTDSGTTLDGGREAPEITTARIRNTSTASGTVDLVLGSA